MKHFVIVIGVSCILTLSSTCFGKNLKPKPVSNYSTEDQAKLDLAVNRVEELNRNVKQVKIEACALLEESSQQQLLQADSDMKKVRLKAKETKLKIMATLPGDIKTKISEAALKLKEARKDLGNTKIELICSSYK